MAIMMMEMIITACSPLRGSQVARYQPSATSDRLICNQLAFAEYPRLFRCASISSTYPGQSLSRSYFRISVLSESLSQWPARVSILEISLLDLDLEAFSFHFSISSYFYFTFISGSQFQVTFFHFSKKVNGIFSSLFTSRLSKTHSRRTLLWALTKHRDDIMAADMEVIMVADMEVDTIWLKWRWA